MPGLTQQLLGGRELQEAALLHDGHALTQRRHGAEVMRMRGVRHLAKRNKCLTPGYLTGTGF